MILAAPCNKSVTSNLSVKSVLNNRQLKNRRDILLRDKNWISRQYPGYRFCLYWQSKNQTNVKSIPEFRVRLVERDGRAHSVLVSGSLDARVRWLEFPHIPSISLKKRARGGGDMGGIPRWGKLKGIVREF